MDEMEQWGALFFDSQRKVITTGDDGDMRIDDTENYFGRPVLGKIVVMSREIAEQFRYDRPWACISISGVNSVFQADISEDNRVAILRLQFDDITHDRPGVITPGQAQQIMEFVAEVWPKVDLLMVHCNAGISRSAAVALVVSERYQPDYVSHIRQLYQPNPRVAKELRLVE